MVKKSRDLVELPVALEAEERVGISEVISVEAVLGTFKGESADAVFHDAAGLEVVEEG